LSFRVIIQGGRRRMFARHGKISMLRFPSKKVVNVCVLKKLYCDLQFSFQYSDRNERNCKKECHKSLILDIKFPVSIK
jgi:hypothetical protein